jgi:hypothetical protein
VPREQHASGARVSYVAVVGRITASVGCWLKNARPGKSVDALIVDIAKPPRRVRKVPTGDIGATSRQVMAGVMSGRMQTACWAVLLYYCTLR